MAAINKSWPKVRPAGNGKRKELWIVDLRPHGKRRYFTSRQEALTVAQKERIKQDNVRRGIPELNDHQKIEAAHVYQLLEKYDVQLIDIAQDYVRQHQYLSRRLRVALLGSLYQRKKTFRSERHRKNVRLQIDSFRRQFVGRRISTVTQAEIETWLKPHKTPVTFNNYRSAVNTFFNWCKRRGYIKDNPIERIDLKPTDKDKLLEILSLEQVKALLKTTAAKYPDLVPVVALALFAGVRPESELWHLSPEHINIAAGEIDIHKSKSAASRRYTKTLHTLKAWLKRFPPVAQAKTETVAKHGDAYYSRFQKLTQAAKIIPWPQDAMRHTFASMHYQEFKSAEETAAEMGHFGGLKTFLRHYKNRVREADANAFWKLTPEVLSESPFPLLLDA